MVSEHFKTVVSIFLFLISESNCKLASRENQICRDQTKREPNTARKYYKVR